jgi:membrane-bound serine protease (ClpP class)
MAEFDGEKLNVVSDGEFIAIGQTVMVERVEGNRIVVREYKG